MAGRGAATTSSLVESSPPRPSRTLSITTYVPGAVYVCWTVLPVPPVTEVPVERRDGAVGVVGSTGVEANGERRVAERGGQREHGDRRPIRPEAPSQKESSQNASQEKNLQSIPHRFPARMLRGPRHLRKIPLPMGDLDTRGRRTILAALSFDKGGL